LTNDEGIDFREFLGIEDSEAVDLRLDVERQLAQLTQRERVILYLFACGDTQAEIGVKVGLSQRHVGRILEGIANKAAGC
jgi:DNA-binding NarL/FixJ family response regulator